MRIWDAPCAVLTDRHLLAEHRELHAIWAVHERGLTGPYGRHPETLRWRGHLRALFLRHEEQARELARRGFAHRSPLGGPPDDSPEWPRARLPGSVPPEAP